MNKEEENLSLSDSNIVTQNSRFYHDRIKDMLWEILSFESRSHEEQWNIYSEYYKINHEIMKWMQSELDKGEVEKK